MSAKSVRNSILKAIESCAVSVAETTSDEVAVRSSSAVDSLAHAYSLLNDAGAFEDEANS